MLTSYHSLVDMTSSNKTITTDTKWNSTKHFLSLSCVAVRSSIYLKYVKSTQPSPLFRALMPPGSPRASRRRHSRGPTHAAAYRRSADVNPTAPPHPCASRDLTQRLTLAPQTHALQRRAIVASAFRQLCDANCSCNLTWLSFNKNKKLERRER